MTRVAVLQMVSSANVDENLASAGRLIQQAVSESAELCLLPENFPLMGMKEHDKLAIQEAQGIGPIQDFLAASAQAHGIWIIGGTIPLEASSRDRIRAAQLVYSPDGECLARYDKIHLFDVSFDNDGEESYQESSTIEPGSEIVVARTPMANIGLSTCYDLRFPELYRNMHADGVDLITVPSAFTYTTGEAHWESLLRARAVENQCYVMAANQGGVHINERETWGHSMIIDPWGKILASIDKGEGIAVADINIEHMHELRRNFPNLKHRKLDYTLQS